MTPLIPTVKLPGDSHSERSGCSGGRSRITRPSSGWSLLGLVSDALRTLGATQRLAPRISLPIATCATTGGSSAPDATGPGCVQVATPSASAQFQPAPATSSAVYPASASVPARQLACAPAARSAASPHSTRCTSVTGPAAAMTPTLKTLVVIVATAPGYSSSVTELARRSTGCWTGDPFPTDCAGLRGSDAFATRNITGITPAMPTFWHPRSRRAPYSMGLHVVPAS